MYFESTVKDNPSVVKVPMVATLVDILRVRFYCLVVILIKCPLAT